MMKKLHKKIDNFLHYWEIWENNNTITIHWGKLGETGESKEIKVKFWQKINKITNQEIEKAENTGFKEIDLEEHHKLIVQFKSIDKWGDEKDLEKKQTIESLLNESLGWTGNGHCDGRDIGSGTINLFSFVVDPGIATNTILTDFKKRKIEDDFIIALQKDDEITVLYPENYKRKFQY
jgi:hypothetical protein